MQLSYQRIRLPLQLGIAAGLLCIGAVASAAHRGAGGGAAEAQYRQDRQACNSSESNQDRATCLKEAAAALAESRRNRLSDGGADYQRNALARCDVQPEADRADCRALARGEGVTRGSVEQGGVIRERTTRVPAPR